jgi:hypothetical protein
MRWIVIDSEVEEAGPLRWNARPAGGRSFFEKARCRRCSIRSTCQSGRLASERRIAQCSGGWLSVVVESLAEDLAAGPLGRPLR